jgi:excisionase family DNA binding protein
MKNDFMSIRQAAMRLGVARVTIPKIAERNGLKVHKLPGHSLSYLRRSEVERLARSFDKGNPPGLAGGSE